MSERFDADVTLDSLQLSLFPTPTVTGGALSVQHHGWNDSHPLIYIRRFTADSSFIDLFLQEDQVHLVRLEGLEIYLPHRGNATSKTIREDDEDIESGQPGSDRTRLRIGIQTIIANGTQLEIAPKEAGKDPMRFDIQQLTLHSVGSSQAMRFEAALRNPKPPGLINTQGRFGPWQKADPRATGLSGDYTFEGADLSVFKGIGGILSSTGSYGGVLQHIEVKGQTDTPDFVLRRKGTPVHLRTTFQATVNGMNGDTILENVDARFLQSEFICKGDVSRAENGKGRRVALYAVTGKSARMQDILQLVMGDEKPAALTGNVQFQSKIVIPPEKEPVIDKLQLNGQFHLTAATFTSPKVNEKLATLSNRARGITARQQQEQSPQQTVASEMSAKFDLKNGTISLRPLSFRIPGATVNLNGTFNMPSRTMQLAGLFRMQSTLSDTQSGVKHWVLKPIDPLFEKDGAGVQLPFEVKGTQEQPVLSVLALHHTFKVK